MQIRDLRAFLAVVSTGRITAAADELHVVQSAVSTAIKRLEQEQGVRLLERGRAGARPTDAGEAFLAHAQTIVNEVDRTHRDMGAFSQGSAGTVRLGIVHTAIPIVLASLLQRVGSRYPEIRLEVSQGVTPQLADLLRTGYLDLAVVLMPVNLTGLQVASLADIALSVFSASNHRLAGHTGVGFGRLEQETWVTFPLKHPGRRWLEAACDQARVRSPSVLEVETLDQIKAYVEAGIGISLLPRHVCDPELTAGVICEITTKDPLPRTEIAHAQTGANKSPAVSAVRAALEGLYG
jgi:LysR family hydrogen peroxide-inducible transcriptional activator